VAPSWLTLPVVTGFTAVGMAPMALAFAAETLPEDVVITPSPAPGVRY
jgi:hypothetical protein